MSKPGSRNKEPSILPAKLGPPIKSWSHSRLMDFEACNYKAFLKIVEKRPDLSPKTAAERGTVVHDECENFVNGKLKTPNAIAVKHFADELNSLRDHYKAGRVSLEGEWGFDRNWQPTEYKTAWLKIKADAVAHLRPDYAVVIDYKTGKRFGNEIKHGEQLMLYSIGTLIRNPKLELTTAELWYFDQNELASTKLPRSRMGSVQRMYDRRGMRMTEATTFPASPNAFSCKWCPYRKADKGGDGFCKFSI